ncbi:hypothetical protein [Litoreibacter roseus]|nr:hypothetical protein [Litoreibacter roseus]
MGKLLKNAAEELISVSERLGRLEACVSDLLHTADPNDFDMSIETLQEFDVADQTLLDLRNLLNGLSGAAPEFTDDRIHRSLEHVKLGALRRRLSGADEPVSRPRKRKMRDIEMF